jgi:hypothetical protein
LSHITLPPGVEVLHAEGDPVVATVLVLAGNKADEEADAATAAAAAAEAPAAVAAAAAAEKKPADKK